MRFTLAQLKAFCHVVQDGSFHAAARQLHLTQPTVSQRVAELESAIGHALFERSGRNVRLTAQGHALVDYARRVLETAAALEDHFKSSSPMRGLLRLGVTESFALICLEALLRRLDADYPELKTSVQVVHSATANQMLAAQALDVAILFEPQFSETIRQEPLGRHELAWMASASMELQDVTKPADLADLHIMLSPPPSRFHTAVMAWFAAGHATPTRVSTCNSLTVTMQTVASGLAIGVLPVRLMRSAIESGSMRRLPVEPPLPTHSVAVCYQTNVFGSGLEAVVHLVRDVATDHQLFV
jgi:DNA-binding transcriptional LysR family regulator